MSRSVHSKSPAPLLCPSPLLCLVPLLSLVFWPGSLGHGHGTVVFPESRVYKVHLSDPDDPDFELAENAVDLDGIASYDNWDSVGRDIPEAVDDGLPEGFDYSEWIPDGEIASAGRTDATEFANTYIGLDQVSEDWPTTMVIAGETIEVDFEVTIEHDGSVWDVWMTTSDWDPATELNWDEMEFLGRPEATYLDEHYTFDLEIPADRSGHHVLWVAWQGVDDEGHTYFSTSDIFIENAPFRRGDSDGNGSVHALIDALDILEYGLADGSTPPCLDAADADDSGSILALLDALFLLSYGFGNGPAPPDPGPTECGQDPEVDDVDCLTVPEVCE